MKGQVITFYSSKGGVGRSLAVANTAWILASSGNQVLVIDWDLEAPGLHRYFRPFLRDPNLLSTKGLIDFVVEFAFDAAATSLAAPPPDLLDFATSLEWDFGDGCIDFVPAGRQDPSYSVRVNDFPWSKFYEQMGGRSLLDSAREEMKSNYDYVLIDSRTGLAELAGICTVQMPDKLVLCFTMNSQSLQDSAMMAKSVRSQRLPSDLFIFPVPMRVDAMEKGRLDQARQQARDLFSSYVSEQSLPATYWGDVEVPYQPFYSYEELLAPFIDQTGSPGTILWAAENLARYLTNGTVNTFSAIPEHLRQEMRERLLRPSAGLA